MSTLGDAVQARIATKRLAQLTRPNDDTASTVDTTYLELAVTDVTAAFETYAQETFDETVDRHVALGVMGVVATLRSWKGTDDDDKQMESWRDSLEAMAKTRSRARVMPASSKSATPSPEPVEQDGSVRPTFDPSRFRDVRPDAPPGSLGTFGPNDWP